MASRFPPYIKREAVKSDSDRTEYEAFGLELDMTMFNKQIINKQLNLS